MHMFWNLCADLQAYLAMFQVSSQQNWPYVMWDAMRSVGRVCAACTAVYTIGFPAQGGFEVALVSFEQAHPLT